MRLIQWRGPLYLFTGILLIIILSFMPPAVAEDEKTPEVTSYRAKKIVSVVYDDSGSMFAEDENGIGSWVYTNYAMQAYLALLHQDDDLYITYMSNPGVSVPYTNLGSRRQEEVNRIREHFSGGGTPFEAVQTAYQTLLNHQSNDPNEEYYLVILTDGGFGFDYNDPNYSMDYLTALDNYMSQYTTTPMNNGNLVQVIYYGIGDYVITPSSMEGLTVFQANGDNLDDALFEVADKTSGRYKVEDSYVKLVDNRTIEMETKIPLVTLGALVQNTNSKIIEARNADGQRLRIESVDIKAPEQEGYQTATDLRGSAYIITSDSDQPIYSGKITLKFDDKITLDNIRLMFEPAITVDLKIMRGALRVDDVNNLHENQVISIEPQVVQIGTGEVIDLSTLPGATDLRLSYQYEGEEEQVFDSFDPVELKLKSQKLHIEASAYLEETFDITRFVDFTPQPFADYQITATKSSGIDQLSRGNIDNLNEYIEFTITADGSELTYDEVRDLPFAISLDGRLPHDLVLNTDNGHYYFKPTYRWPLLFTTQSGTVTVTATTIDDISVQETVNIQDISPAILWSDLLVPVLGILLLMVLIYRYIVKRRFKRGYGLMVQDFYMNQDQTQIVYSTPEGTVQEKKLTGLSLYTLLPVSNRKTVEGITFYPGATAQNIYIKADKKHVPEWYLYGRLEMEVSPNGIAEYTLDNPETEGEPVKVNNNGEIQLPLDNCLVVPVIRNHSYRVYYYHKISSVSRRAKRRGRGLSFAH